jgi:TIR domain
MAFKIFFSYAHEDEELLHKLMSHLKPLQLSGLVDQFWYDREISAGSEWEPEIVKQLNDANIILLLVSSAFMASDYCFSKELRYAIERHERQEVRVIPVILSPVYWQVNPLSKLNALPKDGKAITGPGWHSVDEALLNVVEGISKTIKGMQKKHVPKYSILHRCVAEQVTQGKLITEALKHCDPELLDLFTTLLAEYVHKDASLEMRLEKLLAEISAVGDGDLRVQAEVTSDLLGIVADSINYLICELAKVIIRVQKISGEEIASSKKMLSVVQEEIQMIESIPELVNTSDPITRESITTHLDYMYKSTKALKEDLERRLDLSNRLYASVSTFRLPAEETLY